VLQDSHNIIPVTLAVILHVLVFGSLFVAFDFDRDAPPPLPLAIKASLVTDDATLPPPPPPPVEEQPEPEPEVQQPDPDEEARRQAEEQKRIDDARIERERLKAEEDARKAAEREAAEDEARRKREAEEEAERVRQRLEAERLADIQRQREENERLERESRETLIQEEEAAIAAQNSTEMQVYLNEIRQKVRRNWRRPGTARNDLECIVAVQQVPGGEVTGARVTECNGDAIVQRSVENAVFKASPLPQPENPLLFLRNFTITFTYDD
jgi:colicin import membrane protein